MDIGISRSSFANIMVLVGILGIVSTLNGCSDREQASSHQEPKSSRTVLMSGHHNDPSPFARLEELNNVYPWSGDGFRFFLGRFDGTIFTLTSSIGNDAFATIAIEGRLGQSTNTPWRQFNGVFRMNAKSYRAMLSEIQEMEPQPLPSGTIQIDGTSASFELYAEKKIIDQAKFLNHQESERMAKLIVQNVRPFAANKAIPWHQLSME